MSDVDPTTREVAAANACILQLTAGTPIHGLLRRVGSEGAATTAGASASSPLVTAGLHCSACGVAVGGALDFSGDVGVTDGASAARSLVRTLAERGCGHAAAVAAGLPDDPDPS